MNDEYSIRTLYRIPIDIIQSVQSGKEKILLFTLLLYLMKLDRVHFFLLFIYNFFPYLEIGEPHFASNYGNGQMDIDFKITRIVRNSLLKCNLFLRFNLFKCRLFWNIKIGRNIMPLFRGLVFLLF